MPATKTNSYSWHPLSPEQRPAIQQFFECVEHPTLPLEKLDGLLAMLGERVTTHTHLALAKDGTAVAMGLLLPQNNATLIAITLHPNHSSLEIGRTLLNRLLAAATKTAAPFPLRAIVPDSNQFLYDLYLNNGFEIKMTQIQMHHNLQQPLPEIPLPEAVRVVPYTSKYDEAMRIAFNNAFADHWIGTLDHDAWQQRFTAAPQFSPTLSGLALAGNEVVGLYLSENLDNPSEAWLEILGVVPSWRGRRLGAALATHALTLYKAHGYTNVGLDVDLENSTNAIKLYENLGFKKVKGTVYLWKTTDM